MTKFNFLSFLLLIAVALPILSVAQPRMGAWGDSADVTRNNYYIDYVGGRVNIASPGSIAGPLIHTISNDGNGATTEWGQSIEGLSSPILNVNIVKADPYEACGTLNNAAAINGNIAIIKRGNCEFGAKALAAQNAGAIAVIIVNHLPGPPVGMGAGAQGGSVTIPVIMVSDVDGAKIETALGSGNVTMNMAIWSNGYTNDLGFVDRGLSLWHAFSVPFSQVSGGTSSLQYNGITGAVVANFGSGTSTNTKVKATLSWTPTGGSTSVVRVDSVTIPGSFAASDSIFSPRVDGGYNLNPSGTGRYDVEYELIPSFTDDYLGDNKASYSFYVDNRVFSKGRYDFNTGRPYVGSGSRFASGNPFLWGPMYYMEKAGYQIEHVKFSASKTFDANDNSMAGRGTVNISVWKWVDANSDSVMVAGECSLVGLGSHTFGGTDTSGQTHTVNVSDALNPGTPTVTEANTWYWVAASMPGDLFLGIDGVSNYFVRSWIRNNSTAKIREPFSPIYNGTYQDYFNATSPNDVPAHYPFERFIALEDSIKFSQQKNGYVAALPIQLSLFKVDVNEVENKGFDISVYPNPVNDVMNVSLKLDKQANEVQYAVLNTVGAAVMQETHRNVNNDTYTVSTAQLAAGTYYVVINVDGEIQAKKFTVIK
jgi:hypothetical protein